MFIEDYLESGRCGCVLRTILRVVGMCDYLESGRCGCFFEDNL